MVFQFFVWGPLKEKEKSRLLQDILKIGNTFYRYTGRLFLSSPFVHILAFFTSTPDWTTSTVSFTTPVLLVSTKIFEIFCALRRSSKSCFVLTPLLVSSFQSSFSWFLITFPNACFHYIDIQSRVCFWHLFFIRSTLLSMLLFHMTTMLRLFTTIFLLWREDLIEPAIK